MNNRRKLVMALGAGALTAPFASWAQQGKVWRVGILFASSKSSLNLQAFLQELQRLGYIEGQNVSIVSRFAEGNFERLPALAVELVAQNVDIVFAGSTVVVQAAQRATASIPIVFAVAADPVSSGFVSSLARPGGNITGMSNLSRELSAKRVQILKEMAPKASRVAVLTSDDAPVAHQLAEIQDVAKQLGVNVLPTKLLSRDDLGNAHKLLRNWRADAIVVIDSSTNYFNRKLLVEFAAQARLPAIYAASQYVDAGALISYGANLEDLYRRAAQYVDKILKGAKPADLPVEEPTKFDMVVNMKTAKALGIKIPQSILVQATKVIE